jgi:hypothetical protein
VLRLYVGIVSGRGFIGDMWWMVYDSPASHVIAITVITIIKINENCRVVRKARERTGVFYFSAVGLALVFAAGLAADLAGACKDARRARVLTRLAAWDRLRVFLRALVFGIGSGSLSLQDSK